MKKAKATLRVSDAVIEEIHQANTPRIAEVDTVESLMAKTKVAANKLAKIAGKLHQLERRASPGNRSKRESVAAKMHKQQKRVQELLLMIDQLDPQIGEMMREDMVKRHDHQ